MIGGIADRWHWGPRDLLELTATDLAFWGGIAEDCIRRDREAMKNARR